MSVAFHEQVSAVSPLDGDAIDGAPRPKLGRSHRKFGCRNPQCDHETWAPEEYAKHMGREFWWAVQALLRLAPDSPEAVELGGGVKLADLTDDECRAAASEYAYLRSKDLTISPVIRARASEYDRRLRYGTLTFARQMRRRETVGADKACGSCGHLFTPKRSDAVYCSRQCRDRASRARRKTGGK